MAIQVNPLLTYGLSALAGNSMPQLNLKPISFDIGAQDRGLAEGMMAKAALDEKYAQIANAYMIQQAKNQAAMERLGITEQGLNNRSNASNQNQMAMQQMRTQLGYDQLSQKAGNDKAKLGVDYYKLQQGDKQFDLDKFYKLNQLSQKDQEIHQKQIMDKFNMDMKLKESDLADKSRLYGAFLLAQQSSQDPEQLKAAQQQIINEGVNKGIIQEKDAKGLSQLTPQQFGVHAAIESQFSKTALGAKGQNIVLSFDKDGNPNGIRQGLAAPTKNQLQTDVDNGLTQLAQLQEIGNNYSKDYLTYQGQGKALLGDVLSRTGTSAGQGLQDFTKQKAGFVSQLDRYTFEFVKAMSGVQYSDQQLQAMKQAVINSQDSPATFEGKFGDMVNFMKAGILAKQDMLARGLPLDNKKLFEDTQNKILSQIQGANQEGEKIRVIRKSDGVSGTIDANEFDPNLYDKK